MKESGPSGQLDASGTHSTIKAQKNFLSRFQLELLDEFPGERRGYDPYDTTSAKQRDGWSGKRKRA